MKINKIKSNEYCAEVDKKINIKTDFLTNLKNMTKRHFYTTYYMSTYTMYEFIIAI